MAVVGLLWFIKQEKDGAHTATSSALVVWNLTFGMNERILPHPVYDMSRHSWGCAVSTLYTMDGT